MKKLFAFITKISLRFKWVTIGLSILLFVLGIFAFTQFNQELIPNIEFPQTFVLIQAQGTEAEELVELLTIPIEDRVLQIEDVLNVESTTSSGIAFLQISNQFGLDQEKLQDEIRASMNAAWLESGLARRWASIDPNLLRTTGDVTAEVINEAWEKWPYIFNDLTRSQLLGLPPEAVEALPEAFLITLPETTQKELLDIATGERAPGELVDLPPSWAGISHTADLTPEIVQQILSAAPTMADHFRDDNGDLIESYIFAMSPAVVEVLPDELTTGLDECSHQQLQALLKGDMPPDPPIRLPSAWRNTPPEILTFSLSDLPLAFVSISQEGKSPAELRSLVEDKIVPRLVELEGVANAPVRGGQILPGEPGAEEVLSANNAPSNPGSESGNTPLPDQSLWKMVGAQLGGALGQSVETYEDLTPELTTLVLSLSGSFIEDLNIPLLTPQLLESRLLQDLATEEAVQALPADTLAWMPPAYMNLLSEDLLAEANARVANKTRYDAVGAAAQNARDVGRLPVYFRLFSQMGKQFGLPLTLNSPADLSPEIVSTLDALVPGGTGIELLRPLNSKAWEKVPVETLGWLPADFVEGLDEEARQVVETRAEQVGGVGALAAQAKEKGELPPFFALMAQQPLLGGTRLCGPEDLSPELITGISSFMPGVMSSLPPAALKRLTPEALAVLPSETIEELPDELRAELEEKAESAGGLGAAGAAAAAMNGSSPNMPDSWNNPQLPKTAAELVNNQFGGAAAFLNLILQFDAEGAKLLFHDLEPRHIAYVLENEEDFLENVDPAVLSLLSQEVLDTLPEKYQEIAANAFVPDDAVTRTNGSPSLLLTIYKDTDANTVEAAHRLFDEIDEIEAELEGVEIVVGFEQASFIEESISGVAREGGLGAIFAIVVIFFFLHRSWRSTIVTAVSIPLSVMIAFALMYWVSPAIHDILAPLAESGGGIWNFLITFFPTEVTLNIMTLSGLTVAIGRVVDDSIVVLENIYRHIHNGEEAEYAIREGTRDVSIAILASTITTVIVFLPIGLTGGLVGAFFIPFGMAVSYALGASFVVAITIVPVLARWFVHRQHMPEETETILERTYRPALQWALRGWNRGFVLLASFLLFAVGIGLLLQRPQSFIPPIGEPQITIEVSMPQGTSIIETNKLTLEMEDYIEELKVADRAEDYQTIVGASASIESLIGGGGIDQTKASIDIAVVQGEDMDELAREVRAKAEEIFTAQNVTVSAATISETGFGGLGLVLSGDPETLKEINDEVLATLSEIEGVANLTTSLEQASQTGSGPAILRVNQQPAVKYQGEFETDDTLGTTAAAKKAVNNLLEEKGLTDQITVSEGFESEVQTEGFASIANALLIAIVIVYFVMVLTFRSFVHPFTILFTVPLAIVGVSFAMWITNGVLGLPAMVGLLMLIGIVVTNGIVMIDRVQSNRQERDMERHRALVEGAVTRLRPVLMTAIAAIFALFPLAAQLMGPGGAIVSSALGTVVIGGLLTSTFFTLFVVPVVYSLLSIVEEKLAETIQ